MPILKNLSLYFLENSIVFVEEDKSASKTTIFSSSPIFANVSPKACLVAFIISPPIL